jgi:uncharacterized membrane protein
VPRGQRDGSLRPYSLLCYFLPLLILIMVYVPAYEFVLTALGLHNSESIRARTTLCECTSEVLCASVLVKYFVRVF